MPNQSIRGSKLFVGLRNVLPPACAWAAALLMAFPPASSGVEYFVGLRGDDGAAGVSESTPLRSVAKGVALLKPGDILTILPGDYFESVSARISGTPGAPIVIRARRPGTVVLRGDVDAPDFAPAPGLLYTWQTPFDGRVEGVAERDTLKMYAFVPSAHEAQDVRGSCYYDDAAKTLYVHTSDSGDPANHALVVLTTNGFGLLLSKSPGSKTVHDVIVEGLAFSGYTSREQGGTPGGNTRWGLYFVEAERCVARRCTAFLNGGGIGMVRPVDCIVEDCVGFGNFSPYNKSGGNIVCFTPASNSVIRRCVAHASQSNGIRFYGDGAVNCAIEDCLAYDCSYGEIWIKGGDNRTSRMSRNIALGALNFNGALVENISSNIFEYGLNPCTNADSNIKLAGLRKKAQDECFADPERHDYRLQSDAFLRGKGIDGADPGPWPYRDEVFFVSLTGNDTNAGTSVKQAWRTLAHAAKTAGPRQTVYVLPGTYEEPLAPARSGEEGRPIRFRNRGYAPVTLAGTGALIRLAGRACVEVDGFRIEQPADAAGSSNCVLRNCTIGGPLTATGAAGLVVEHCALAQLKLDNCRDVALTGNVFLEGAGRPAGEAALTLDQATLASLFSDWNAAAGKGPFAAVGGKVCADLEAWRRDSGLDTRSRTVPAGNRSSIPGRGPLASMQGPIDRRRVDVPLRIEGVKVHSRSATTANIEWWTPTMEATTLLEWGDTPECTNRVENVFDGAIFHTVGLSGLKPDTTYYFRVKAAAPAWEFHVNEELAAAEREKNRESAADSGGSFQTLKADAPPRTLHVAPAGDDKNDGLTQATAWRTLRRAAAGVIAGDTVLIQAGVYQEHVPVRATGDRERPITFKAAPGAKVWMDGSNVKRPTAFRLAFKSHVVLDGLYLRNFRQSHYQSSAESGAITIIGGSDHILRRCFYDGRSINYMPFFVLANRTLNCALENCVIINGWNGVYFQQCPDLQIRNCVFYNGLIRNMNILNKAEEPVRLTHNLICDVIPGKSGSSLVSLWHLESYRGDDNVFFCRRPIAKQPVVSYIRIKGEMNRGVLTLAQLREQTGQDQRSVFANPGIPVTPEMRPKYDNEEDYFRIEMHRKRSVAKQSDIEPLDFKDFFADPAGPCGKAADGKPIGLDPAAFAESGGNRAGKD